MATTLELPAKPKLPEQYELVDNKVLAVPRMCFYSSAVANNLNMHAICFVKENPCGTTYMNAIFRLPLREDPNRNRKPDMAYVSFERWPEDRTTPYRGNAFDVVPELMVEVVSPNDEMDDILGRTSEYLRAGAKLVWVFIPILQQVYSYTSLTSVRIYTIDDILDGGDVLPGFEVRVAELFPPMAD